MKRLLSYNVANLQGKGSREYQEDSFGFVNALDVTEIRIKGLFAAVADGMGGMQGGREASTLVMKTMMADAPMDGSIIGRVTVKSVFTGDAPDILDASSSEGSIRSNARQSVINAKG